MQKSSFKFALEHGPNFTTPGGLQVVLNRNGPGLGGAGVNFNGGGLNSVDRLAHATDGSTWEEFSMEFDVSGGASAADITTVLVDGALQADLQLATNVQPFLNETFYIGGRNGGVLPMVGNIDELQVEGLVAVPEPSSLLLCGLGMVSAVMLRRRRLLH